MARKTPSERDPLLSSSPNILEQHKETEGIEGVDSHVNSPEEDEVDSKRAERHVNSLGKGETECEGGRSESIGKEMDGDIEVSRSLAVRSRVVATLVLMFFMAGNVMTVPLLTQYIYYRKSQLFLNTSTPVVAKPTPCVENNVTTPELEAIYHRIQQETAHFGENTNLIYGVLATVANLIYGSYSDYIGRRTLMMVPIVGGVVKSIILAFLIHWDLSLYWIFLTSSIEGITGSFVTILLACFSISADVTRPDQERTLAITLVESALAFVVAVFLLANGVLIDAVGFVWPTVLMAATALVAALLVIFCLPETLRRKNSVVWSPLRHLRNAIGFYCLDGSCRRRVVYCLLMGTFFFTNISILARTGLESVYQLSEPFCWTSTSIAIFSAVTNVVRSIGFPITLLLLRCCMGDELIAAVGLLAGAGSLVLEGLAVNDLQMYMTTVPAIPSAVATPIARSFLSKLSPPEMQGALFSSIASMEALCFLCSSYIANAVYVATVASFQGTVFIVMAGTSIIGIVCILVFKCINKEKV